MKEKDLQIDRRCHVVYSKACKKIILAKLRLHYPSSEVDEVFEQIQYQYERYLAAFCHQDLGGKKNFHNHLGGTYDCIMLVCYYVVCKDKTSFAEVQEMTTELTVGPYKKLSFVDLDKPVYRRLMYRAFCGAEKRCAKWHDFEMRVDPYSKDKPLHYCFTRCPFADFIRQFGLQEIAGALCNVDYASMAAMNVKLFRQHTCVESDHCDYTFYSNKDPFVEEHPEYIDALGFIRNK